MVASVTAAIGELALLTGEPRAATIVAVREKDDTVQLRIAQSVSVEAERSAIARLQEMEKEVETSK
jgi:hypothetical protein